MDSLTYDQQSTPGMMDALIEMLRLKQQQNSAGVSPSAAPQGVGPVVSGDQYGQDIQQPDGVGPLKYGYPYLKSLEQSRDPRAIPMDNGETSAPPILQDSPIDQIEAMMRPGSIAIPATMTRDIASNAGQMRYAGPDPTTIVTPSAEPKQADPQKEIAKSMIDEAPIAPEQKVEAKAHVDALPKKKPEAPQQAPTEDASPMQKMAMIAMALAPTLVGYAAAGTKGAYLGAASTGKGLSAGVDTYMAEQKIKATREKKQGTASQPKPDKVLTDKENNMWFQSEDNTVSAVVDPKTGQQMKKPTAAASQQKIVENQYGQKFTLNPDNTLKPIVGPEGQLRSPNTPVSRFDTNTREIILSDKYEQQPGTTKPVKRATLGSIFDSIGRQAKVMKVDPNTIPIDEQVAQYVQSNPEMTMDELKKQDPVFASKVQADYNSAMKILAPKKKADEKPAGDRAGDARYSQTVKGMVDREYVPLNDLKNRTQPYLDQMNKDLKNVTDPMKWQSFLKTIQQDASVVRPGESEMAMQFMPVSQKIDSWFNRYGKLDSVMTAELGRDINQLFVNLQKIKESNFVDKMNEEKLNAANLGKDRIFEQSMTGDGKTIVKDWAREHLAGSKKMTPAEVAQGMKAGQLKNGDMFYSPQGKPYMIRGIKYDGNTFQQTTPGRAVPWRFQP